MPSLISTWPYFARLMAPTSALGNLWHILLATATRPGTPRLIIPGVKTKAPPEPINPLTSPPMKPTTNKYKTFHKDKSIKLAISCISLFPLKLLLQHVVEAADVLCHKYVSPQTLYEEPFSLLRYQELTRNNR